VRGGKRNKQGWGGGDWGEGIKGGKAREGSDRGGGRESKWGSIGGIVGRMNTKGGADKIRREESGGGTSLGVRRDRDD